MNHKRNIGLLIATAGLLAMSGCNGTNAGNQARTGLLTPAIQNQTWPIVRDYANRGIDSAVRDGDLGENAAELPRESVRLMDEAVRELGGSG